MINAKLSPGEAAATQVIVARSVAAPVSAALAKEPAVAAVVPAGASKNGELEQLRVTLNLDPFSDAANAEIPVLRDAVSAAAAGETALVGGFTATNFDTNRSLERDAKIIVPLILLLVFLILVILLRAVVAPLYLVATVVLSYAFALGASKLIFTHVFGVSDSDASLATFAFLFLVALGVDYNIFLISRIREESAKVGIKEGVIGGPGEDRGGDHQRRPDSRRDLRGADVAAAGGALPARIHGRPRTAGRHLPGPHRAGAIDRLPARRAQLVAVAPGCGG